ncbi:MAG: flagellar biosynthesis repressor FlbT [Syntrophus sp. PtaU1.Bin005]|jgi:flagellar protein FlbT|uniref:flagellar biosynthesis repressor FlbT n=1 Tax=Syntrophus TaxID=43773 RepID=UPI0009C9D0F1|nr:MAG: flagellar biosynthesis repressor FlbT [Syntrophus sp. PtaB.Bin138]OPY81426.1 MAG: flagellar biosynthesis repressor FlbT [Syntrophus sp. PtaU1.Bin005]
MALKIRLKPQEKMILNGAVITNGKSHSEFVIENRVMILREKDILRIDDAKSYCSQIYLAIQMMYIDGGKNLAAYHKTFWDLVRELVKAVPSTAEHVGVISEHLLKNEYYQALKAARKLMDYEQEVLNRVRSAN